VQRRVYIKYINAEWHDYSNDLIITSDIESSALFLDVGLDGVASLTMNYPRDKYLFKFTSGNFAKINSFADLDDLNSLTYKINSARLDMKLRGDIQKRAFSYIKMKSQGCVK
jgi:hypothetical protein